MKYILAILITLSVMSVTYAGATSPGDFYVSSGKLNVRLAANINGKITNTLYKRQKVEVFEVKDGGLVYLAIMTGQLKECLI
jgi:hypothetical protein